MYSSNTTELTTDDELSEEDIISDSSHRPPRNGHKANINSINSSSSEIRSNMFKSFSQDHDCGHSNHKEDKNDNHICHSESCSELPSCTSIPHQRSSSDSPNNKFNRIEKITQKSIDEETASTDSNSTKDYDNKSTNDKKRSFFGLRKRKNSKLS